MFLSSVINCKLLEIIFFIYWYLCFPHFPVVVCAQVNATSILWMIYQMMGNHIYIYIYIYSHLYVYYTYTYKKLFMDSGRCMFIYMLFILSIWCESSWRGQMCQVQRIEWRQLVATQRRRWLWRREQSALRTTCWWSAVSWFPGSSQRKGCALLVPGTHFA